MSHLDRSFRPFHRNEAQRKVNPYATHNFWCHRWNRECLVEQALTAGHNVTAVVRDPTRLTVPLHPRLQVVTADVMDRSPSLRRSTASTPC